jgi:lysophospholipid acyltransferase (LPLAT)-like uncharacterized protein
MRLWAGTLRIEASASDLALMRDTSTPTVLLFWHNRLFMAAEVYRRFRRPKPTFGLVSTSKDGAWLAAFFQLSGLGSVRGSSSRRGREAVLNLAVKLAEGNDVAVTPDGPRGPKYSFKPGPAMLIGRTGSRALLFGTSFASAWRLGSWDGFFLPRPFSKVTVCCRQMTASDLPAGFAAAAEVLRVRLTEMNGD